MLTDKEIRDKLVSRGASSLSDDELLSILVGDGGSSYSAVGMAAGILGEHSLTELSRMDLRQLRMLRGLGIKRAAMLSAALELGHRMMAAETSKADTIMGSEDVTRLLKPQLGPLRHEEFWVLYLNSANRILDKVRISQGGVMGTIVDYKLIVKRAVELLSPAIVIAHNHPSGIPAPSDEDVLLTNKLVTAASLFDITVLDHVIITDGPMFSFRGEGLIE